MFSAANGRARDRTRPITPALLVAYTGAIGKEYRPALEAVQTIKPLEGVVLGVVTLAEFLEI